MWISNCVPGLRIDDYKNRLSIKNTPTKVDFFEDKEANYIYVGPRHTGIVTTAGDLYTFGSGNWGILGHGDENSVDFNTPKKVDYFAKKALKVKKVVLGDFHSLALTEDGNVYSWGYGGRPGYLFGYVLSQAGALGHGNKEHRFYPKCIEFFVENNIKIVDIAAGIRHSVAVSESGDVYTWGYGEHGMLGNGANKDSEVPMRNEYLEFYKNEDPDNAVVKIDCADQYTATVTKKGDLFVWGKNNSGQLGIGVNTGLDVMEAEKFPTLVKNQGVKFVDVSCGENVMMIKDAESNLYKTGWRINYTPERFSVTNKIKPDFFFCGNKYFSMLSNGDIYQWGNLFPDKLTEKSDEDMLRVKQNFFGNEKVRQVSGKFKLVGAIVDKI